MEWLVLLEGKEWCLGDLPQWFSQLDHKVRCVEGRYYLTSSAFGQCTNSAEVWGIAEQVIERINAAAKAFNPQFQPVQVSDEVVQIDESGKRRNHQRVRAGTGEAHGKGRNATILVDGKSSAPQPSREERLVARWEKERYDSEVARALRVWLLPRQTWGSLYHIRDIIVHDMSGRKLAKPRKKQSGSDVVKALRSLLPHMTEAQLNDDLNRFRETANDPKHAGIHSRHGHPYPQSITNPMSLDEAERLIHSLMVAWLSTKI